MATLTAEIDGRTLVVDLSAITAWDAYAWEVVGLGALDACVAAVADPETVLTATGLAMVAWLYERQNGRPSVSVEAVARTITLFPAPVGAGDVDAPEAD
jgi:hypothetical protein